MDPRLEALAGPDFFRVFGAVASLAGAADEEAWDVAAIEPAAGRAIAGIMVQARGGNPDPASRLLLLRGATGTGKTHALLTAVRALHRQEHAYGVVLPMVDLASEAQFDAWLERTVITRLSEPYLVPEHAPVPLRRLAASLLDKAPPSLANAFLEAIADGGTDIPQAKFKLLVNSVRIALAGPTRVPPASEAFIAALLGVLAVHDDAFDYLCGLPVDGAIGPIRLCSGETGLAPRERFEELVKVIGSLGGALAIAFDQLEQSKLEGWEARARHAISRGALLTETLPHLAVAFAVLPALYDTVAEGIDGSIRDRIERLGAQPVRLKPLSRPEVEALLSRRLAVLYEAAGAVVDASDPLYPFEPWAVDELSGSTSRYVTEFVQEFQRLLIEKGHIPQPEDFTPSVPDPAPESDDPGAAPPVRPTGPGEPAGQTDFDALWDKSQASFATSSVPHTGLQQAVLLEWAIKAAAPELDGVDAIRTWQDVRGRAQTVVVGVEIEAGGRVVERRDVALCNEPNHGAQLAGEIGAVLAGCGEGCRPVLVRPRGGRFPKGGRTAGPLLEAARAKGAIIVGQFERASWERIQKAKDAFDLIHIIPGFFDWQKRARPLTRTPSLGDILQFPYREPAEEAAAGAPDAAEAAPPPLVPRWAPSAPSVLLGEQGDGQAVHWAPFDSNPSLLNFGTLVTGDSGSGKTQTLRVLIDGVVAMGAPVCIFDFKNDYADRDFVAHQGLRVHDMRRNGLPFNPLLPSAAEDGKAQPIEHIFTISGVLKRVFGLGDRQAAVLRDAMKDAFERHGINPQRWVAVDGIRAPCFDDVVAILEEQKETRNPIAIGLLDRVAPLFELGLFPRKHELDTPFEQMLGEKLVLSLFELPTDEIKAALAELIIIRLHGHLVRGAQPRRLTRLMVLDEAWRVSRSTHLENLAREGRAFGVGLAIGTQYPGDLPPDLAGALATKIFLKNQQPDHKKAVVRALCGSMSSAQAQEIHDILEKQEMFEGVIQNQQYAPYAAFRLVPYFARKEVGGEGQGVPRRAAQ